MRALSHCPRCGGETPLAHIEPTPARIVEAFSVADRVLPNDAGLILDAGTENWLYCNHCRIRHYYGSGIFSWPWPEGPPKLQDSQIADYEDAPQWIVVG